MAAGTRDRRDHARYPLDNLLYDLGQIATLDSTWPKGYERTWNVLTCRMVDIYREEQAKVRQIDSWNRIQEMEALRKGLDQPDTDEGYE